MINKIKCYLSKLKGIKFSDTTNLLRTCDVLFFCHDVDRGVSLNNKAYSPLIDSVRDELEEQGYTCVSIAHPWSRLTGKHSHGEPIAINRPHFLAKVLKKIFPLANVRPDLKLYKNILTKTKPKVIITIGCHNELCEAARDMHIFHLELLHGIGYTPIPWGWEKKQKQHLPQGILSLDSVSTHTFSELGKYGVVIKEIKHPFLNRFQQDKLNRIPQEWQPKKKDSKFEKEILISLQWGYAQNVDEHDFFKGTLTNGLFYEELAEVIKLTHDKIFWRFRFHPVQYRQPEKYKNLFDFIDEFVKRNENCEWQESTYLPLPSLLINCSGHVTMSSMSNYEAAYMGVPTLALCPSLREGGVYEHFFNDLIDEGYLQKATSQTDTILKWVSSSEKKRPLLILSGLNISKALEEYLV